MSQSLKLYQHCFLFLQHLYQIKRNVCGLLFCLPPSLLALLLFLLLVCNGFSVFYIHLPLPLPAKSPPEPANFLPDNLSGKGLKTLSSSVMRAEKENPPVILKTHLPVLHKPAFSVRPINHSVVLSPTQGRKFRAVTKILRLEGKSNDFPTRIQGFFDNPGCKVRFFMTWISALESFGDRELLAIQSLFKYHPNACLVIVSSSMDSKRGSRLVLRPFLDKGFKIIAIKPNFNYIFKDSHAESWYRELKKGNVDPGGISLGQNLSNLLRLALLYKFGGIYVDTDVIILRSLANLKNAIGAQTVDLETGKWTRLNNAVLIFDKRHPLLFKFIEEFALTFNGNKWGHNGPYLVTRVVVRVKNRPEFNNFTVLPPSAFYPVNWRRIRSLFRGPRDELHSKWLNKKLDQLKRESFAVHLWNKQSRTIKVEEGSIVDRVRLDSCIFCNSSRSTL